MGEATFTTPPIRCTRAATLDALPVGLLALTRPVAVTVEEWAEDGMRTARLPGLPLHADSLISDVDAVVKLGEEIVTFHKKLSALEREGRLCGVLRDEWNTLSALVKENP